MDRRIREAQERGDFNQLSGKGKPLNLGQDHLVDRDAWVANQVLKNAGMVPVWMELAKEIDKIDDLLRSIQTEQGEWLDRTAERLEGLSGDVWRAEQPGVAALHRRYLARARGLLMAKQRLVDRFNFIVPARFLEKAPVIMERDLTEFRAKFRLLAGVFDWPDVALPDPIRFETNEPEPINILFDDDGGMDDGYAASDPRRSKLVEVNRKLRNKKPSKGIPLDWLARLNPLGHAAELLRNSRARWFDDDGS